MHFLVRPFKFIFCSNEEISVGQEIGSKDFIWLNQPSVLISNCSNIAWILFNWILI